MIIILLLFFFEKNNTQSVIKNIRMAYLSLSKASPVHTHFNERGCILVTCYEFQQEESGFVQPFVVYTAAVVVPLNSYYLKKKKKNSVQF